MVGENCPRQGRVDNLEMGEEKIWFDGRVLVRRRTLCKPSFAVGAITSNGRNCVSSGEENGGINLLCVSDVTL